MMNATCVVCLILVYSGLVVGEVLYYCRNDTVILICDKSNTTVIWNGPDHQDDSVLYAIGGIIDPNLPKSKKERLSIIHDEADQFDLKIERFSHEDGGNYSCVRESHQITLLVKSFHLKMAHPPTVKFKFEEIKSSRELQCIPEGIPDRYFFSQWEHKSAYLEHIRFLNGSGKLVIPFVSGETDRHHDIGIYICNVSNNVSFSEKRFISANYHLNASGNPYFVTSNNKTQYCSVRRICNISVDFVSFPSATNFSIIFNTTSKIQRNYVLEDTKTMDTVYDKKISVKAYRLTVFLDVNTKEDYGIYTVLVTNSIDQGNFSVLLKSADEENIMAYLGLLILVIPIVVLCVVLYLHHKQGYICRFTNIRCCKWHQFISKAEIIGENELHELQNSLGRNPAVQNTNTPASSSIDSRNSRNIGQAISYSETQKCKLDLPERKKQDKVGIENPYNDSGIEEVKPSVSLDCDKKTSDELNYIEVHFESKPNECQFKMHGIDKETDYVEIDFSKKACAQSNTANDSESDHDSSSSDDIIW